MQPRRISYAPAPVAPSSFRGSPASTTAESEEDDQATVVWQGGRSALPSRTQAHAPVAQQQWSETPMAFEPPPARVPTAMPSIAPMEMDMQVAAPSTRKGDVLTWLPLASVACVVVAVAALLFAVALTSFRKPETATNASVGAAMTTVLPVSARTAAPPLMPVIAPTMSEPVSLGTPSEQATASNVESSPEPIAPPVAAHEVRQPRVATVAPRTVAPKTTVPATMAPTTTAPVAPPVTRTERTDRSVTVPAEQPAKKTAAPRVDDEAASAQKMLEEAQRETAGAL